MCQASNSILVQASRKGVVGELHASLSDIPMFDGWMGQCGYGGVRKFPNRVVKIFSNYY